MEELKKINICVDDTCYQTHTTPAFERTGKWEHPDDRNVGAIIPGTIVEIFVKEGDAVAENTPMLVIEAMKMNNQIKFNRDGIVDKILVKPGDIVSKGHILIILK